MAFLSAESLSSCFHPTAPWTLLFTPWKSQLPCIHNCVFSFPAKLSHLLQTDYTGLSDPFYLLVVLMLSFPQPTDSYRAPRACGLLSLYISVCPKAFSPSRGYLGRNGSRVADISGSSSTFLPSTCYLDSLRDKMWATVLQRIQQMRIFQRTEDCFFTASLGARCWLQVFMFFSFFLCHNPF